MTVIPLGQSHIFSSNIKDDHNKIQNIVKCKIFYVRTFLILFYLNAISFHIHLLFAKAPVVTPLFNQMLNFNLQNPCRPQDGADTIFISFSSLLCKNASRESELTRSSLSSILALKKAHMYDYDISLTAFDFI